MKEVPHVLLARPKSRRWLDGIHVQRLSCGLDARQTEHDCGCGRKLGAEVGVVDQLKHPKVVWTAFRAASGTWDVSRSEEKALMQQPGFTITPPCRRGQQGHAVVLKQRIIGDSGRQYTNEQKDLFKHVGREVDEKTTLESQVLDREELGAGLFDQFAPVKTCRTMPIP